jgi:type II secretory pathway component GspD/PulD (secretin)
VNSSCGIGRRFITVSAISQAFDITVSLASNVRVKLGATIALGGVYSTVETTQEHRVPGLASIPFLGRIFRYESQSSSTAELILFITPTLIPAADVAQAM